jgi:ATP-binding cassette subfamily C (CFTR/MRP) protein 1
MAQSSLDACTRIDDSFGPHAGDCRGGFDFTLLFEETILTLVTVGILLIVLPPRAWYLSGRVKKVAIGDRSSAIKISAWVVLATLQLSALILWAVPSAGRTRVTLLAAALTLVSTLGLCLLSYAEHTRAVKPSSLINTFLLGTLLFDIAHTRTLWLRAADHVNQSISYISTAAVVVKFAVLVLEAVDKRRSLRPEYQAYPPEATSSIYNRSFFWWLNPLFWQGFSRDLVVDDLFVLDKHIQASYCYTRFQAAWSSREYLVLSSFLSLGTLALLPFSFFSLPLFFLCFPVPFALFPTRHAANHFRPGH